MKLARPYGPCLDATYVVLNLKTKLNVKVCRLTM